MDRTNLKSRIGLLVLGLILFSALPCELFAEQITPDARQEQQSDEREIKGVITDAVIKEPLIGVSIINKRTNAIATSDIDGNYKIKADNGDVIEFSFIGMETQTITVAPGVNTNIELKASSEMLDEMVVVGYGTAKKISSIVGAATTVKSDVFKSVPAASAGDALQGQVAGLQVYSSTGEPGSDVTMRLRGVNSINASNTPLFILDGSPVDVGIFTSMNPNDIETMTVLKDASSAAIYGSRAANGVVYITTKKGKEEKPVIQLTASYGVSNVANYPVELMSSEQWFKFREMADPSLVNNTQFQELKQFRLSNNIGCNWKDWILQENAPTWKADLSLSGRTNRMDYYVSLGAFDQQGIEPFSYLSRYNMRTNLNVKVTEWLKIGTNTTISYQEQSAAGYSTSGTGYYNPMNIALWSLPYAVPYEIKTDTNGKFLGYGEELDYISDLGLWNYYDRMEAQPSVNSTFRLNSNLYEEITPVKGLTIRAAQAIDGADYRYTGKVLPNDMGLATVTEETFSRFYRLTSTNTIEYKFDIAKKNHINILGGHESILYKKEGFGASSTGISDDRMTNVDQGITYEKPTYSHSETTQNSFFIRLSYDYADKYFIDATFRTDGSSLFGDNNKYANFYSFGAMWNIKEESFAKDIEWINNLQLKASYGTMGNSGIDNYLSYGLTESGKQYAGNPSWYLSSLSNPNLTWETLENLNIGLNATLFDKFSFNIEFYNKLTKNMLMYIPYSFQTGFSGGWGNVGNMRNRGVDLELRYDILNTKDWYFNVAFNMNYNKNMITELFGGRDEFVDGRSGLKYEVGKPYGEFYLVEYAGVDPATGKQLWYDKDGNITSTYSESDAKFIGKNRYAPWSGGLNFNLSWRGLALNASFSGVFGKYIENYDRYFIENPSFADESNMTVRMLNIWTEPGQITDIPKAGETIKHDSRWIDNASFVRLKNLQLSYTFPRELIQRSQVLSGLKVYATGRNLLTFTGYKGIDPEVDYETASGDYPNTKQITVGVEFTF
ncbi:MAG: TonB-dependent receptor [Bacteroidales bacterium]|nr:TonB-dependent receptor [Bacteroidales bacterium]